MEVLYYAVIALAWTVGGFISGVTSMGCSLIAMPVLTLVMSPDRAILISCVCGGVIPALLVPLHHRGIILRELLLLLGASLPGSAAGVLIFEQVPAAWLNIALGFALAGFVIWQAHGTGVGLRLRRYGPASLLAGFLGGAANALTGMPGSVLGVYATLRTWSKENMLSMQSAFFALSALLTISIQWSRGLYSPSILFDIACSLPGAALGILASIPAQRLINRRSCRRLLLVLLGLSAVTLFCRGMAMR